MGLVQVSFIIQWQNKIKRKRNALNKSLPFVVAITFANNNKNNSHLLTKAIK